jgi:prepilin-type N-terminal cleavage/methylation domain-containing protein
MIRLRAGLRLLKQRRSDEDQGFSLIETMVAASIFGIFMTGVMLAVISMLQSTAKTQSLEDGQANLEKVFQKLDHQIRYADGIHWETQLGTNKWYVEWRSQATPLNPQLCTELRFDSTARTLAERSWQPLTPLTTTTQWAQLASNVSSANPSGPSFSPFIWQKSGPDQAGVQWDHEQVAIMLATQFGGTKTSRSVSSGQNSSFTALNSTANTNASLVCTEVAHS